MLCHYTRVADEIRSLAVKKWRRNTFTRERLVAADLGSCVSCYNGVFRLQRLERAGDGAFLRPTRSDTRPDPAREDASPAALPRSLQSCNRGRAGWLPSWNMT